MRNAILAAALVLTTTANAQPVSDQYRRAFVQEHGAQYAAMCTRAVAQSAPRLTQSQRDRFCRCQMGLFTENMNEREADALLAELRGRQTLEQMEASQAILDRLDNALNERCIAPILRELQ